LTTTSPTRARRSRYRQLTDEQWARQHYGPWQTEWRRHWRFAAEGTWDEVLAGLAAEADAEQMIDATVSVVTWLRS
jgi:hypothetical protein